MAKLVKKTSSFFAAVAVILTSVLFGSTPVQADPVAFTVTRAGWNVVGLDSNDVTAGPNQFPQSAKVCNTSTDTVATGVQVSWSWTSNNALINLDGDDTKVVGDLAASACATVWWTVTVTRDAAAYDTSRTYSLSANDGGSATAISSSQLVYVEHLISQNRNVVNGVTGPASVSVGDTVQFVLSGATATQGYEQIVTAPILDSSIFEITGVVGTYAVGGSVSDFYVDGCGWDPAGNNVSSWNCLATGKAGGDPITVTVSAKVIGAGTATVGGVIYDFSGSSFHYNSDFSSTALTVTAAVPTPAVVATDESATTDKDVNVLVDVLANDTPTAGTLDLASVVVTVAPSNGSVTVDPVTGKITYDPNLGFTGTDSFTYKVCLVADPTVCDEATVTVTISDPSAIAIDAANDSKNTNVDVAVDIDVTANDSATNGSIDKGSITITAQPANGTVTRDLVTGKITYEPNTKYVGTDTFKYTVCIVEDPSVCDEATVTVTIVDVEQSGTEANPKLKVEELEEGKNLVIDPNTLDPNVTDIDPSTIEVVTPPGSGEVTIDPTTGEITFKPASGIDGPVTFTIKMASRGNPTVFTFVTFEVTVGGSTEEREVTSALADTGRTMPTAPLFVGLGLLLLGLGLGLARKRS